MHETRRNDLLALALLTSVIALLFIDILSGTNVLASRDLLRYSYPEKKVLREIVLDSEFPWWNRSVSAGQPMAANPAHEIFYPLTWVILLPSYGYALQLFIVLHLLLAAWAMYALLRSLALRPASAFLGALSFSIGGLVLSYITLLPFLAPVAWIPLICLFARRFVLHRAWRDLALAALCFSMQVLIFEPTTLLQTGLLLGLYAMHKKGARGIAPIAMIAVAALLLGSVQALPAFDHARDSVRARGFSFDAVTDWSAPPARIGEVFFPHFLGHMLLDGRRVYWGETLYGDRITPFLPSIYPGLLIAALALAGLIARVRGTRLVLIVLAISFLLALGAHTPLWHWLYSAGPARSIRYPEKFLLSAIFAITVFGAKVLDALLEGDERLRTIALRVVGAITIFAAVCALLVLTPWHAPLFAKLWHPSGRLFEAMLTASRNAWLLALARGVLLFFLLRLRRPVWLALFVLLDLAPLMPELAPRSDPSFLTATPAVLQPLPPNHSEYRLFHHASRHVNRAQVAPYFQNVPDQRWVYRNAALPLVPNAHGIQTAIEDDFDATSLLVSADFADAVWQLSDKRPDWVNVAASMSNVWYRAVFIDPRQAFARAQGDLRKLQPVRILTLPPSPRYAFAQQLITIRDRNDFVQKLTAGPYEHMAFVEGPSFVPAPGRVLQVHETANTARINVETTGRAFLIMSVTPHKYWRIAIDGRDAAPIITNIGYQGVIVPNAGRHVITMRYRNPLVLIGAAISLITLLALAAGQYSTVLSRPRTDRER